MKLFWKQTAVLLASAALVSNTQAFWLSASKAEKELKDLDHEVTFSENFGTWRDQGQSGVFRLVVVESEEKYAHSLVFLQWIKTSPQGARKSTVSVVVSVPIKEINFTAAYKLSDPKVGGAEGALGGIAEITGVNNYSHSVQGIRIQPKNVGEYSLKFINGPTEKFKATSMQVENAVYSLPASE